MKLNVNYFMEIHNNVQEKITVKIVYVQKKVMQIHIKIV
jgi:hypothetical protein